MLEVSINLCLPISTNRMRPVVLTCVFWLLAIWLEPMLSDLFAWFKPNLFFLFSLLFSLRWRGNETIFISVLFGLSADSFSSLPFGTMSLVFFLFSIFLRWYAVKIYQESQFIVVLLAGIFTLTINILILLTLLIIFSVNYLSIGWLNSMIFFEVIPTALLAGPFFKLFITLESKLRIRLAERKF